jgi:hypothetical protein
MMWWVVSISGLVAWLNVRRVAIDRGLRLAEKRQLPLGARRQKWLDARDALYEEIQVRSS